MRYEIALEYTLIVRELDSQIGRKWCSGYFTAWERRIETKLLRGLPTALFTAGRTWLQHGPPSWYPELIPLSHEDHHLLAFQSTTPAAQWLYYNPVEGTKLFCSLAVQFKIV